MASSGSGIHDDSFYPTFGGGTGVATTSGESHIPPSQIPIISFSNSGERSGKDSSYHQGLPRESGRRER